MEKTSSRAEIAEELISRGAFGGAVAGMPRPVVDVEKCTGCGTCASVCPSSVFEVRDDKAVVARPEDCVGCRACEASCPQGAIAVKE